MSRPDTPFPKHWRYYLFIKWAVIAGAIVLALKLLGAF
jgi:NhaP-type Na+/H+ or K+/H+ antiporter